jgi:hypothetical protein
LNGAFPVLEHEEAVHGLDFEHAKNLAVEPDGNLSAIADHPEPLPFAVGEHDLTSNPKVFYHLPQVVMSQRQPYQGGPTMRGRSIV